MPAGVERSVAYASCVDYLLLLWIFTVPYGYGTLRQVVVRATSYLITGEVHPASASEVCISTMGCQDTYDYRATLPV